MNSHQLVLSQLRSDFTAALADNNLKVATTYARISIETLEQAINADPRNPGDLALDEDLRNWEETLEVLLYRQERQWGPNSYTR